jgi:glycosyltransferase involved in cell wall biosynthesis
MADALPRRMDVKKAEKPLNILFVYGRIPFPMLRGDQLTVSHLLSFLSARGHNVDFFTLATGGTMTPAQEAWLNETCRSVHMFSHPRPYAAAKALLGLLRGKPLQIGWFDNARQKQAIRAALERGGYDIVYAYYIRSADAAAIAARPHTGGNGAGAAAPQPARFLAMQLSQALNTRRMAAHFNNVLERALFILESRLVRGYEAKVWRRFDRTVLIGPRDVAEITAACEAHGQPPINNFVYGPHGVDIDRFRIMPKELEQPRRVVFSGTMRTNTNVDAVTWFVRAAWPLIRAQEPEAEFYIVGADPAPSILALNGRDGITVTGRVPHVGDEIARAAVCVNPMRMAAGMQNKLIEYLACGKAVVATAIANEGIGGRDGEELLIADTPDGIADAVVSLLRDEARREALGVAGRAFVERAWTWEHHFLKLERDFYDACGKGEGIPIATSMNSMNDSGCRPHD